MIIVHAYPPNIDAIDAVFKVRGRKGVIFTYGEKIYVPDGGDVSPELRSHEGVHYSRQTNDVRKIEAWWDRYLVDPEFRLTEELPAHRAEYKQFRAAHRDPNARIRFLHQVAARLSGPLYGGLIKSQSHARRLILKGG